jgi:hypothetical protein
MHPTLITLNLILIVFVYVDINKTTIPINPTNSEVYSIQHYVIKFVSDLQQVSGFLRLPPPIKLTFVI